MSILDITVSCFKNYRTSNNPQNVNLLTWLHSKKYQKQVEIIRNTTDKETIRKLKSELPAITVSGTFSHRSKDHLIQYSGLMCVDIDLKGNTNISNYTELAKEFQNLQEVAYCGRSVSGKGYFLIIPILYPNQHLEHFKALQKDFAKYGIEIDESCSDISRLRGYSVDDKAYFNHQAKRYRKLCKCSPQPLKQVYQPSFTPDADFTKKRVEQLISIIHSKRQDITTTYYNWFRVGCAFANEFGESGRAYFHQVSCFYPRYEAPQTDRQFDKCMNATSIGISTFFYLCSDFGVRLKEY